FPSRGFFPAESAPLSAPPFSSGAFSESSTGFPQFAQTLSSGPSSAPQFLQYFMLFFPPCTFCRMAVCHSWRRAGISCSALNNYISILYLPHHAKVLEKG